MQFSLGALLVAVAWGLSWLPEFSGDPESWKRYLRFTTRYVAPVALLIVFIDFVTP